MNVRDRLIQNRTNRNASHTRALQSFSFGSTDALAAVSRHQKSIRATTKAIHPDAPANKKADEFSLIGLRQDV